MAVKPYQQIPIVECGEPLVPLPLKQFAIASPHPYVALGAPYGDKSPYYLRQQVLERLIAAQQQLQHYRPGWQIQVFDAYRPIAVQQFMVDYTFAELVAAQGRAIANLTESEQQAIWQQVHQFWAVPNHDPTTPPPHSTGAAIDVTLVDTSGHPVDMGSPIDEISPRSYPDFFADRPEPDAQQAHQHRQLLRQIMFSAGFLQHPNEWWHFCYGDQMWTWLSRETQANPSAIAQYGRVEP